MVSIIESSLLCNVLPLFSFTSLSLVVWIVWIINTDMLQIYLQIAKIKQEQRVLTIILSEKKIRKFGLKVKRNSSFPEDPFGNCRAVFGERFII